MSAGYIGVQRLRLVAGRGAGAHALRARVEDALRTSSKPPGLAHRLLLIRRLRLSLPREASAQSLALRLEQEWRRLEALAEPMATASPEAEAVRAVDEVEARLLLLRRWLEGRSSEAWFWQRLLPVAVSPAPLVQRIVGLLFEPLAAVAASPSLEQALQRRLWREAWPQVVAAKQGHVVAAVLNPQQRRLLQQALRDPASAGESLSLPSWVAPEEVSPMAPLLRPQATATTLPRLVPWRSEPAQPHAVAHGPVLSEPASEVAALAANQVMARAITCVEPSSDWLEQATVPTRAVESTVDGQATDWAGLWFLLPLLQQQGLAQQPAPTRLLASLLQRAAMRHDLDAPALAWLAQFAPLDDERADGWWRRARWACVRHARLPLLRLLRRPGRVWLSPQRIDLWLPLARADIRIRRAGFDIDPGYVPWLDCVIHYHYS